MHVDLRHFQAFLSVVRLGTFTRAASFLHVSQPALTVQIRQLEQALGLRLLDRNNRRVVLTQPGRQLVPSVERLLVDFDAILRHADDLTARRSGVVTLAVLPSIATELLPAALKELARRHEGLIVRVRDVVAGQIIDLVKAHEVDFGIGTLERPDPDLTWRPLFSDRLCAFVPADLPRPAGAVLSLAELSRHPLILTSRDSSVRQLVERTLARRKLAVTVAHEVTYMSTALGMVRAGLGVAILPESAARGMKELGVRAVRIDDPLLRRDIGVLSQGGRSLSPAGEAVLSVLQTMGASSKEVRTPGTRARVRPRQ